MIRRDVAQLAVYRIEQEAETLPSAYLENIYLDKPSEIVYIVRDNKLYGIVCLSDVVHHSQNGYVRVNKNFTVLTGYNGIKAREIFRMKRNIHKIPVVNKQGELIGDYSRWDDEMYIDRNQERLMKKRVAEKALRPYAHIYVVEPAGKRNCYYLQLIKYLEEFGMEYTALGKNEFFDRLSERSICIFLSEDQKRGMQCRYGISLDRNEKPTDIRWKIRMTTYARLLYQMMQDMELERLKIQKPEDSLYSRIDDKVTVLFSELQNRGIKCFCMYLDEYETTEYVEKFSKEINKRVAEHPINIHEPWPKIEDNRVFFEAFYGDLCHLKDYKEETAQKEISWGLHSFRYIRNISGKYFNAKDGRRVTCFQPDKYIGTIYLLGPCTIVGGYSEDQFTIASYLQKKLLEKGYTYRVENYGGMLRIDSEVDSRLQEIGEYNANDIVIILSRIGSAVNIKGVSLAKIFENNNVPSEWVTDGYTHCNHKVNQLVAESMLAMMLPCLERSVGREMVSAEKIKIDFQDVMRSYIWNKYLSHYFAHFQGRQYETLGAIVMNCNPFSKGHRYLIEQAGKQVEFLIVFAVEEDLSLFSFEERIRMIREGTEDLHNVMVVPSGEFILSQNNMQEYFNKEDMEIKDRLVSMNAEYDITVFADYIAGPLHVTHRFAGEEPEDRVTGIYNEAMKKILPEKGITFVEIPRVTVESEIVSASKVRRYMKDEEYDKAFALLPETTQKYMM